MLNFGKATYLSLSFEFISSERLSKLIGRFSNRFSVFPCATTIDNL